MVDSHALVGSCAQVGQRVHVSAAAQLGGVLEPVGALPVIVEDEVLVGGNCGVYEGTVVGRRAVLAAGVILTGSVTVYDLVSGARTSSTGSGQETSRSRSRKAPSWCRARGPRPIPSRASTAFRCTRP
jgi:2,3,4,5-tetrahydropyridine-2-carboxylate N-succinyltransferase